jgi:hypothetical protein
VIAVGRPDAQTLILVEKVHHGGVTTKQILPVRFSQFDNEPVQNVLLALLRQGATGEPAWR